MSIAPAPISTFNAAPSDGDQSLQANQTQSNFGGNGRVSPEPMLPPIRGAEPAPERSSGLAKRYDELND